MPTRLGPSCVGADLVVGIDSLAVHLSLKDDKITEYTFDGGEAARRVEAGDIKKRLLRPHPKSPNHRNRRASFSKRSGPASG